MRALKHAKLGTLFLMVSFIGFSGLDSVQAALENQSNIPAQRSEVTAESIVKPSELGSSWRDRLYLDALASWGISSSALPAANGGATISQVGLGGTVGWKVDRLLWVGLSTDFRSAGLSADLLSTVSEVEGARVNIAAPTVGVYLGESILKAEVSLLGDYRFSRQGQNAEAYRLSSPRGLRMTYLYPMVDRFHAGVQGEVTSWGEKTEAGQLVAERLMQRQVLWQASLTAAWVF